MLQKCKQCGALKIPPWTVFFMGILAVINLWGAAFGYGPMYRWVVATVAVVWLLWSLVQWRRNAAT